MVAHPFEVVLGLLELGVVLALSVVLLVLVIGTWVGLLVLVGVVLLELPRKMRICEVRRAVHTLLYHSLGLRVGVFIQDL